MSAIHECRFVLRKIGYVLMIVAVLAATGVHWMILQSVAWTTMLVENLHTEPLNQAIVCTFDGKHLCCLCKRIAKEKQSEKKSDLHLDWRRLDCSYSNPEFALYPPFDFYELRSADETALLIDHAPAVPPPKSVLG
jgi:hypothetical protein